MSDYKELLSRYERELSQLDSKIVVTRSKVDGLLRELGMDELDMEVLRKRREELEERARKYDDELNELVAEYERMCGR